MSEIEMVLETLRSHPLVADLLKQGLRIFVNRAVGVLKSRCEKSPEISPEQVRLRIDRLEDSFEELRYTVATAELNGTWSAITADRELADPSAETFIDRATDISINTRSEAKRRFIGRLIARRLQSDGTEDTERTVDQALTIAGVLSERELLALAAIAFIHHLGDPVENFVDLDAVEQWLSEHHGGSVRAILSGPEWDNDTLEHLGHFGAVALHLRGGVAMSDIPEHGDAMDQFLAQRGLSMQILIRDPHTAAEYGNIRTRYPTMMAISDISRGRQFELGSSLASYRLDCQYLTAAGELLGEEIVATISKTLA